MIKVSWSPTGHLVNDVFKFNISHYPGVDSVIFVAQLKTAEAGNDAFVELINVTDDRSISELRTGLTEETFVESRNLLDQFPDEEITLRVMIKTQYFRPYSSSIAQIKRAYLFLYR